LSTNSSPKDSREEEWEELEPKVVYRLPDSFCQIEVVTIDDHDYICMVLERTGVSLVHSASCKPIASSSSIFQASRAVS
jgi:hypothetical protein